MEHERREFRLRVEPGRVPELQTGSATQGLPLKRRVLAGLSIVEHVAAPAPGFDRPRPLQLGELLCLGGLRFAWNGAFLRASRAVESADPLFVARQGRGWVLGGSLAALAGGIDDSTWLGDERARLDLLRFGRVLPPLTLHRGIGSTAPGESLLLDACVQGAGLTRHQSSDPVPLLLDRMAMIRSGAKMARPARSGPAQGLARVCPAVFADLDLAADCARATGQPVSDSAETAYAARGLADSSDLPIPAIWARDSFRTWGSVAMVGGGLRHPWAESDAGKRLAGTNPRSLLDATSRRVQAEWIALREPIRQSLARVPAEAVDAVFEAAWVFPERVARLARLAPGPAPTDWLDAAAAALAGTWPAEGARTGVAAVWPGASGTRPAWGTDPFDLFAMRGLQGAASGIGAWFKATPKRVWRLRQVPPGPAREVLAQRLLAIVSAQFIETQTLPHLETGGHAY